MKNLSKGNLSSLFCALIFGSLLILSACATKKLAEGEELVEYKDVNYKVQRKNQLTKEEIREDCDMLKYILYTCYSGINESMELGLDLDGSIENIYNQTLKQKIPGTNLYSRDDFVSIIRNTMAKNMHIEDQHLGIDGNLKDSTNLYYSKIYFEKLDDGRFALKKCDEDKISLEPGKIYTGPDNNLYKNLVDGEILYRYGVLTKIRVKTANLSVDNEIFTVPVKTEDVIYQKSAWNGLKTTTDSMYISLSDCFNLNGLNDNNSFTEEIFEEDLKKISESAKNKQNIVFDLRSNTGGYFEFPIKMLVAAYYFNHSEEEKQNIEGLMMNSLTENCLRIISPFHMQNRKIIYKENWKKQFELLNDETKAFYKSYWQSMKFKPVRKFTTCLDYKTTLSEFPTPDFQGSVYILLNRRSASAAELGTAAAFLLQNQGINVKIIGENSCGAVKYVGLFNYKLPNSAVYMSIPSVIGLAPIFDEIFQFNGEGKGFYPDFWAPSESILETLIDCTGDAEIESVLAGLEKEML